MSFPIYTTSCVICISNKLKYLKNEARESKTYSVILSVLSNKTNLIQSPVDKMANKKIFNMSYFLKSIVIKSLKFAFENI